MIIETWLIKNLTLDPKYCDVIIKRWENLTGQTAELITA